MKLSEKMKACKGDAPQFPCHGVNGYAGEMDGTHPILYLFQFSSLKKADEVFPAGLPVGTKINWVKRVKGFDGSWWDVCVGHWSDKPRPQFNENQNKHMIS